MTATSPVAGAVADIDGGPTGPRIGAFFDLDGTLVDGFTAMAHAGDRIRRRQAHLGEVLGVIEASLRYRFGKLQFERLLTRAAGYLRGESLAELDELGEWLFAERVAARVLAPMRDVVSAHQRAGHTVVLSSSALTIHAEPVARSLGIDRVLCNHFEVDDAGRLTGRIERPVIWGAAKAAAVQRYSDSHDVAIADSYFYADGNEDIALMSVIGHPRPVNPRPALAAAAVAHGWPVLRVPGPRSRLAAVRDAAGLIVALAARIVGR
ncbi:HAD family hydrolase [Mycobacterium sp. MYCO198283]|uniref:HAD family hydrolase n=1 Tax=Mycobacterium sp. MYCO198283 TaxID=2883505 RepID=UPI0035ABE5E3